MVLGPQFGSPVVGSREGPKSVPLKKLEARKRAVRAGSIISATAVAFTDTWRAGVNAKWYATRGFGWRHPDNWKTRTYFCVYGMDGRPCGPNGSWTPMFPAQLHCLPHQCCSRVHTAMGFPEPLCTDIDMLCPIQHGAYSYGKCKCSEGKCGGDTECREEINDHGGAYCRCKEGFVGDGTECFEDKCRDMDCSPGFCQQEKLEARCECPSGFEFVDSTCKPFPICKRGLKDVCGPPERVLQCVDVGRTDYTCVCAAGYAVVDGLSGKYCESASNTLSCSEKACGTQGVKECKNAPGGGVTCTCEDGYLLEKQSDGLKFRCAPIDPCKSTPCGSETVAKSCTRTVGGSYHCECQPTAELVEATDTEGPFCRQVEEPMEILPYVAAAGGGLAFLALVFGVWHFGFAPAPSTANDFDYTTEPMAGYM